MSTRRVSAEAGWVSGARPKGPTGRPLCRRCEGECPAGRRTFCSDACVDAWRIKTSPSFVRQLVEQRDHGVCALCGTDCIALLKELRKLPYLERRERYEALRIPRGRTASLWDADHIIPVVEGGGECDLDNYRTLCIPCHRGVTAALRKRTAERRRQDAPDITPAPAAQCSLALDGAA